MKRTGPFQIRILKNESRVPKLCACRPAAPGQSTEPVAVLFNYFVVLLTA